MWLNNINALKQTQYSNVSGQHGADFHSSPPWGQALKGHQVHLLGHVIINGESKKNERAKFLKLLENGGLLSVFWLWLFANKWNIFILSQLIITIFYITIFYHV